MLKKHFIILIILLTSNVVFAQDSKLSCTIRYFNKSIYYPNKSIPVKIIIQNNSTSSQTFDIADQRTFNVDFQVETLKKEILPHQEKFIIARNTNQPVFVREVRLEPGDEYNFTVDLASYIIIDKAGLYKVTANFQTSINNGKPLDSVKSNSLVLSVTNGSEDRKTEMLANEATIEILKSEALSPDKVVEYTILARQKSQWNKFFLYLDLKSLFLNNEDRFRKYTRATEEEQLTMMDNFKNSIQNGSVENEIIQIPYSFEIVNTTYTTNKAEVIVYSKYKYPDYTENKKYTYNLTKTDMVWYITTYEVMNLGTE